MKHEIDIPDDLLVDENGVEYEPIEIDYPKKGEYFLNPFHNIINIADIDFDREVRLILKPKRWRAKEGGEYWTMGSLFEPMLADENGHNIDDTRYNNHLYAKTKAEIETVIEKMLAVARGE